MIKFVNRHSFLFSILGALAALAIALFYDGFRAVDWLVLLAAAALLTLAFRRFNAGPGSRSREGILGPIGSGTPVLLEVQSRY